MADTGFVIAAVGANLDDGGTAWSNPDRITADDGSNTIVSMIDGKSSTSDILKATYPDLASSIPDGATIDGIEMQVQAQVQVQDSGSVTAVGSLSKDGSSAAGGTRNFSAFTTSMADYTVGGASDLWDTTWSRAEVINANFSTFFDVSVSDTQIVGVDAVWVKIYYTEGSADTPVAVDIGIAAAATTGIAVAKSLAVAIDAAVSVVAGIAYAMMVAAGIAAGATVTLARGYAVAVAAGVAASVAVGVGRLFGVLVEAGISASVRVFRAFSGRRRPFLRRNGISSFWRGRP